MRIRYSDLLGVRQRYLLSEVKAAAEEQGFVHVVYFPQNRAYPVSEIDEWLAVNCGDHVVHREVSASRVYSFRFLAALDAMAFKMRWC